MEIPDRKPAPIAVRGYAHAPPRQSQMPAELRGLLNASDTTLIFDTETTTDASQRLRFGTYQVRVKGILDEKGIFFDQDALTDSEIATLLAYCDEHGLQSLTVETFIEDIFFGIGYDLRATIVGFNLPFDISRLAIDHSSARGGMKGGSTFKLSERKDRPRVQIKHLSRRAALIRFNTPAKQRAARGM